MTDGESAPTDAIGFLTVVEHDEQGLIGAYLILNSSGRPLEFHCTAPVKPTRTQQILFGPTLDSYLIGEQIGQTLLASASAQPLALCTDVERGLLVREYTTLPLALVIPPAAPSSPEAVAPADQTWRMDVSHGSSTPLSVFEVGRNRLAVPGGRTEDQELLAARLQGVLALDLCEPFGRIRDAIAEANHSVRT
ncbi:MAG TPA: hypothetical protein VL175_22230 [Pirellulales bacterium]|jgi:hypothetical protein|nr:hypothetical protein [Pirellulales bacterium]